MEFLKNKFEDEEAQFAETLRAQNNRANGGYLTRLTETVGRLKKAIEAGEQLLAREACKAECEALLRKLTFVSACSASPGERLVVAKMIKRTVSRCCRVTGEELSAPPCDTVLAVH